MLPYLSERTRRAWAAAEALAIGRGGNAIVAEAVGLSRTTLTKAKQEVLSQVGIPTRQRQKGGGRKRLVETDTTLVEALDALIDPSTRGDPESPLRWTCKSTYHLAEALTDQGHPVSQRTVYRLLDALGYSLQVNRKTEEGIDHPDRDAQFHFIYRQVKRFQKKQQPVISVDTKRRIVAISPGRGKYGNRKVSLPKSIRMIFLIPKRAKYARMAFMIQPAMKVGLMWGSVVTRRSLPSKAFGAGGTRWAKHAIRTRTSC